jgi:hypothetical protein
VFAKTGDGILLGSGAVCRGGEGFGMIAPALRATDFTFTSISDAI